MITAPPRGARELFTATVVVWLVLEVRQSTNRRPGARIADRGSRPALRVASGIGALGAVVAAELVPSAAIGARAAAAWVGLAVCWCGIGLRLWSFRTLGRYFTFTVQTSHDQPVITDGPYRLVRHPSYAGMILAVVGVGLFVGNWLSVACLAVALTVGVVYRIRIEERALEDELGDDYRRYAATHKRLVPFVW